MNKTRINNMIKLLESYSNKKVILKEDDEFDLNSFLKPNPNQLERYQQELERRRREFEENLKNMNLSLDKITKTYKNKQWESEEEELFLKSFYNCKTKVNLKKYPNYIFIIKDDEEIAYQDLKNKLFGIDYRSIWKVFENKFHWDYDEIQSFMKIMLNEHFKLRGYTPLQGCFSFIPWLNEHFKLRGYTPKFWLFSYEYKLNEHFKLKK